MILTEAPSSNKEKMKVLNEAVEALESKHGKGTIMRMGSKDIMNIPVIPVGVYGIDYEVIQVGGIPRGRITEIYGPESSGKTTLALQVAANAQKDGGTVAYIDVENALDPLYAAALGVDIENMFISQPDYGEQALEIADQLIQTRAVDVLVIDSIAALVPKAELEGSMEDASRMGAAAQMMSKAMRKMTSNLRNNSTAVIFINQIREKIGVTYGSNETTPGGRAMRFYASLRLDIRRTEGVKDSDEVAIANVTKVRATKNKLASPFRETKVHLVYGKGIDAARSLADCAIERGVVAKDKGSWLSFDGVRFNGRGQLADALRTNTNDLEQKLLQKMLE